VLGGENTALTDQLQLVRALAAFAEAEARAGRNDEAESALREAVGRTGRLKDDFRGFTNLDVPFADAWASTRLARRLASGSESGRAEALALLDGAVGGLNDLLQRSGDVFHFRTARADALAERARLHLASGRDDPARDDSLEAQAQLKRLVDEAPDAPDLYDGTADVLLSLALLARRPGGEGEAVARERRNAAVEASNAALRINPANPEYRRRSERIAAMKP
jgi:hypothetical protein